MKLTVAICTWERAALLEQTLACMAAELRCPAGVEWELLVVNNNSSDHTDEVARSFMGQLPLRLLHEPRQGHAAARNRAVDAAGGDYVLWTDDDVLVGPDWIEAYVQAFLRHPEAWFFGGPVDPWFDGPKPRWLDSTLHMLSDAYALRDLGPDEILLEATRLPFGANMAYRSDVQRKVRYDVNFGHMGRGRVAGEETRTMQHMLLLGGSGWWVPGARVSHFIQRDRLTPAYLRDYYRGKGTRQFRMDGDRANAKGTARLAARALLASARCRVDRFADRPAEWMPALKESSMARGYVLAHLRSALVSRFGRSGTPSLPASTDSLHLQDVEPPRAQ